MNQIIELESFYIVGIAVRTTNENQQAASDIPALWARFMSENILEKIPNKVNNDIYSVYTDYELDYTKPYTTIIGCKVLNSTDVPDEMVSKLIVGGKYQIHEAKGNLKDNIVFNEWVHIWNTEIDRAYTNDFEIYTEKSFSPTDDQVNIYLAVK